MPDHHDLANLVWQIADLLRGPYTPPQYERVMLPMTVLRRFDCVLAGTKDTEAQNYMREHHTAAQLYTYGQDYNKRAFATAASEMLLKEVVHTGSSDNVRFGDIFSDDKFSGETFDYVIANPPFGVDWKKQQREFTREHESGKGRFNAGLPRVNDGSLLFVQHMISKFEPVLPHKNQHGSRMAIVLSGSPLFTGGAGSGESDIRKWIIESDWLEAIIALPEQMFYNTGIGTYIWIITNRKEKRRKGKIQLVDARSYWQPGGSEENRRSLGDKRRHISTAQIEQIVKLYDRRSDAEHSKTFDNADFGYTRVTVERPLRDEAGVIQKDKHGKPKPDAKLRDFENVPLKEDNDAYFKREVLPHVPDAWMDRSKDKVGYEINFNRHFYTFTPPRELAEIDAEIDAEIEPAEKEFMRLFKEVTK